MANRKREIVTESKKITRKPYPDLDRRIIIAEEKITRLQNLNEHREALIEMTEQKLAERREALEKSNAALESAISLKDKLVAAKDLPPKSYGVRAANAAEKAAIAELKAKLEAQGKTLEDLINSL